jgi:hypothetical protein
LTFHEREYEEITQEGRYRGGIRNTEQENQPSPKKMKTGHIAPSSSNKKTEDVPKDGYVESGYTQRGDEISKSAPSKLTREKVALDENEAILAAIYEPSESSEEFQEQVGKIMGDQAGSLDKTGRVRLSRCELLHEIEMEEMRNVNKLSDASLDPGEKIMEKRGRTDVEMEEA